MTPQNIKAQLIEKAQELGFAEIGIASALQARDHGEALTTWLQDGRQGEMAWMAERVEQRSSPLSLWPDAKSIIVLGTNYTPGFDPLALHDRKERGIISVYARNRDYHDIIKTRLKHLARFMVERWGGEVKVFVDTAPVMEKPLAQDGGLGWQGRHTNLVSRSHGSWLFLSEIFTTLDLPPDSHHSFLCGSCRACQSACPTDAISGEGEIDARLCVSYLTIEHKGHIPKALRAKIGNRIYGCDDCLAVCPWNKFAPPTQDAAFLPRMELMAPRLADLAQFDDQSFREFFSGSPIKRIGRDRFIRNVLIAIGNSGLAELACLARDKTRDSSPLVRVAAIWALGRLDYDLWHETRKSALIEEEDQAVREEWLSGGQDD